MSRLNMIAALFSFILIQLLVYGQNPVSNPITDRVIPGDLAIVLEDWIQMPATFGDGAGGRARLSVLRDLPDDRIFINDNRGPLYVISANAPAGSSPSLYMNINMELGSAFKVSPGLGTGFQSFTFHPEFLSNGKFYTVHSEAWNAVPASEIDFRGPVAPVSGSGNALQAVVTEWTATNAQSNIFAGTRRELFRVYFPTQLHAIQEISFNPNAVEGDPDHGLLYICIGEGGSYLEGMSGNQHRLDSPMGAIFRIDPSGSNSANGNYGIPEDNPWAHTANPSVIREVYAYGFRNPHRISWDRGGAGRAYIGDIGETNLEEINLLIPGGDYGFPQREGTFLLKATQPQDNGNVYPLPENDAENGYIYPVAQYDHDEGIAISLGPVYRGDLPGLNGMLLFGDVAWGRIFAVEESTLESGSQASFSEVRVEMDGTEGDLRSFIGSNRADLRFGMDRNDQVYLLTKTDGMIRKIVDTRVTQSCIVSLPENWQLVRDFTDGMNGLNVVHTGTGGGIAVKDNPFGDSGNQVLLVDGSNSTVRTSFPEIPVGSTASVYFRFALEDSAVNARFGLATMDSPMQVTNAQILLNASGDGNLSVYDGRAVTMLSNDLRPGVWYEIWVVFPCDKNTFDVYIRGDNWTAPALLRSGVSPRVALNESIRTFIWGTDASSPAGAELYFDDLYIDPEANNLSSAVGNDWALIANFESETALNNWTFADVTGSSETEPPLSSVEWIEELSGNRYLSIQATFGAGKRTYAYIRLPRQVEVSEVATLYVRLRVEAFPTNQIWGLVNVAESQITSLEFESLEAMGRITSLAGEDHILIRDGSAYQAAADPVGSDIVATFSHGIWYEYWMVIRNGGRASGGQTYDVYLRKDGESGEPVRVYTNADFRVGRESPMRSFAIIADNAQDLVLQHVGYDDIYLIPGEVLERPTQVDAGLLPGSRGGKHIPWFGTVSDIYIPWVYHESQGWLYLTGESSAGAWAYHMELGWIWISPISYPYVYRLPAADWFTVD